MLTVLLWCRSCQWKEGIYLSGSLPSFISHPSNVAPHGVAWIPAHFQAASFEPLWELFGRPDPVCGIVSESRSAGRNQGFCVRLVSLGKPAGKWWPRQCNQVRGQAAGRAKSLRKQVKWRESEEVPKMYPTHLTPRIPQILRTFLLYPLPDYNMKHAVTFLRKRSPRFSLGGEVKL